MSDYSSFTVAQLKEALKEKGLPVDGKKADLLQRLLDNVKQEAPAGGELDDEEEEVEAPKAAEPESVPEPVPESAAAPTEEAKPENGASTEEVPAEKEEKPKPKVLTPEERKQLAVELLTKKVKRAEKFGDEAAAEAARKDLARVEKFGVELGTGLAREIGILDKNFNQGLRTHKFNNKHKKGFKKNNKKGGFKQRNGKERR